LPFAPAFAADPGLVADLRGLLGRDAALAPGFAFFRVIVRPFVFAVSHAAVGSELLIGEIVGAVPDGPLPQRHPADPSP
jgi:hypothetical protein